MSAEVKTNFYVGDRPWHGLGIRLDNPATSKEAIITAGLDWEVRLDNIAHEIYPEGAINTNWEKIPSHNAVVRNTDDKVLGVVGNRYQPLQNVNAFGFMDSLVYDGSMKYHVAGSLKGGTKVFILGKIGTTNIVPNDAVDKYLLLVNTHDGSGSVRVLFTAVRVVCENTVNLALRQEKGQGLAVRHVGDIMAKVEQSKEILGIAQKQFGQFEDFARNITKINFNTEMLENFTKAILPSPIDPEKMKRTEARREKQRNKIIELFETGVGQDIPGVPGTGWAAYNAVTEYLNYHRPVRGKKLQEEKRLNQVMFDNPKILQNATNFLIAA